MPRLPFTWNPKGLTQLSFKDFRLFPISARQQLISGMVTMIIVIIGALVSTLLPISNLNLVIFALVGFFCADRIHPHPLIGPAAVTSAIVGLGWSLVMLIPDYIFLPPTFMLIMAGNLFASLSVGAILATVLKARA
jgi:hypothetical protein